MQDMDISVGACTTEKHEATNEPLTVGEPLPGSKSKLGIIIIIMVVCMHES